jgi:hypothetical protein
MNPEERLLLPKQAFSGFGSRYQRPELAEGFQDITEIRFEVSQPRALLPTKNALILLITLKVSWHAS